MTPEQIDTVANALIETHAAVDTFWPGLAVAASLWAATWTTRRITTAIRRRRTTPRTIRQLENYANHPANRSPRKEDR